MSESPQVTEFKCPECGGTELEYVEIITYNVIQDSGGYHVEWDHCSEDSTPRCAQCESALRIGEWDMDLYDGNIWLYE